MIMLPMRTYVPRSNRQPHVELIIIVKRCKLMWYGHVSRSSGLAKTHLARYSERGKKTRLTEKRLR